MKKGKGKGKKAGTFDASNEVQIPCVPSSVEMCSGPPGDSHIGTPLENYGLWAMGHELGHELYHELYHEL